MALARVTVRDAEALLLPSVAVMVAVFVLETLTVVTVKFAELEPEETITCAGTLAAELLDESKTVTPFVPAAFERVTVPAEVAPPVTDDGFRTTLETVGAAAGWIVRLAEELLPFSEAEIDAVVVLETVEVVTAKVVEVDPEEIVTCDGTLAAPLFEDKLTTVPPEPAACEMVTVPVELEPPVTDDGLSETWFTVIFGGVIVRAAEPLLPPLIDAEIFAVVFEVTDWVLTWNVPELLPEAIVSCDGTFAAPLSELKLTTIPLDPAFCDNVTVPMDELPPVTDEGLKETD